MPFAKAQFDKVLCLGVLQHTPNFEQSVQSLIEMVKPGGELVVDFYGVNGFWTKLQAKYLYRPFTKKMSNEKLYHLIEENVDWMIKTSFFFCSFLRHTFTTILRIQPSKLPSNLNW